MYYFSKEMNTKSTLTTLHYKNDFSAKW